MEMKKMVLATIAALALVAIVYVLYNWSPAPPMQVPPMQNNFEAFSSDSAAPADQVQVGSGVQVGQMPYMVDASESIEFVEQPQGLSVEGNASQMNQLPSECYPKDVLSSADLLPRDANSLWAQVNPSGQGSLADQNFLTAGFHIGINTVGQTLRNANRQLRSEPLNPQVKVSPWLQTTIEPDINRRPLEIQGDL
jgi:hypothetical protein